MSNFVYKAIVQTPLGPVYDFAHTKEAAVAKVLSVHQGEHIRKTLKVYIYTGGKEATT